MHPTKAGRLARDTYGQSTDLRRRRSASIEIERRIARGRHLLAKVDLLVDEATRGVFDADDAKSASSWPRLRQKSSGSEAYLDQSEMH